MTTPDWEEFVTAALGYRTVREMNTRLGARVYLEAAPGLRVLCTVTNAKSSYGKERLEIAPVAGEGKAWVNASSVTPVPGENMPSQNTGVA